MPTYTDALSNERADSADLLDLAPQELGSAPDRGGQRRPSAVGTLTRRTFGIGAAAAMTAVVSGYTDEDPKPAARAPEVRTR